MRKYERVVNLEWKAFKIRAFQQVYYKILTGQSLNNLMSAFGKLILHVAIMIYVLWEIEHSSHLSITDRT